MSIIEAIRNRKSVRTYSDQPISPEIKEQINQHIATLKAPFQAKVRIQLINTQHGNEKLKLGTYGVISGASCFLTLVYEEGYMAEYDAGYAFEQVILYCTQLGLGTCWLGGTFKHKDFEGQVPLNSNERLRIVSPLGYERPGKRMVESLMRSMAKSDKRKPFGSLFFAGDFSTPLPEEGSEIYRQPLNMVRLAPSASNTQPWRIIQEENKLHFYHTSASRFSSIDMGIALCHFEQTCIELNIPGRFEVLSDKPVNKEYTYTVSWICNP